MERWSAVLCILTSVDADAERHACSHADGVLHDRRLPQDCQHATRQSACCACAEVLAISASCSQCVSGTPLITLASAAHMIFASQPFANARDICIVPATAVLAPTRFSQPRLRGHPSGAAMPPRQAQNQESLPAGDYGMQSASQGSELHMYVYIAR